MPGKEKRFFHKGANKPSFRRPIAGDAPIGHHVVWKNGKRRRRSRGGEKKKKKGFAE